MENISQLTQFLQLLHHVADLHLGILAKVGPDFLKHFHQPVSGSLSPTPGSFSEERGGEKRKPPLAPPRSPFLKERKIRRKIRDDDIKGILDSVIAAVSNSSLNIDDKREFLETDADCLGEEDNQIITDENVSDPKSCEAERNLIRVKVSNHEAMKASNARMDNMWDNVLNSSSLSLHNNNKLVQTRIIEVKMVRLGMFPMGESPIYEIIFNHHNFSESEVKETYIGGVEPLNYCRSQSYTHLSPSDCDNKVRLNILSVYLYQLPI